MTALAQKLELVSLDTLKPYSKNPRRGDVEAIRQSLRTNGQYRPVVVREKTREVLAGNHTLKAAREEGWTELWATFVDVDAKTAKRIVLVDNRSNDLAGYDDQALVDLLGSLPSIEGTGYSQQDVDDLIARTVLADAERPSDDAPVLPTEPTTKPGDLYALGDHRLLCGDSTNAEHAERLMVGGLAQMVMADPPYNVGYAGGTNRGGGQVKRTRDDAYEDEFPDYAGWLTQVLECGFAASDAQAALHLWHSTSQARAILQALDAARWQDRTLIVWDKGSIQGGLGQTSKQYRTRFEPMFYAHKRGKVPRWYGPGNESDMWECPGPRANPLHPTMKPLALYERSISNHTRPGDIVLELFGGSGTTLMVCEQLRRKARLMELDPGYCDVIVARWEEHTGRKAELVTQEAVAA